MAMIHASIGFHCGSGDGPRGTTFASYISGLKKTFPHFTAAQIFVSNPKSFYHSNWSDKTCSDVLVSCASNNVKLYIHAPYIINPCAWTGGGAENPDGEKIRSLVVNLLTKGKAMGAYGVVIHVGKSLKLGEEEGMRRMTAFCSAVLDSVGDKGCRLLIETCAGQGTEVARDLRTFGVFIQELVGRYGESRVGSCVDTCHVFASGYKMEGLCTLVGETIGWSNVGLIHLNDSQTACGARVDRHEIVNHGKIGGEALSTFCKAVHAVRPDMSYVLETPMTEDGASRVVEMDWLHGLFNTV